MTLFLLCAINALALYGAGRVVWKMGFDHGRALEQKIQRAKAKALKEGRERAKP